MSFKPYTEKIKTKIGIQNRIRIDFPGSRSGSGSASKWNGSETLLRSLFWASNLRTIFILFFYHFDPFRFISYNGFQIYFFLCSYLSTLLYWRGVTLYRTWARAGRKNVGTFLNKYKNKKNTKKQFIRLIS